MSRVTTEQIFATVFALAQTVQGTDWAGNPIPLAYSSRNWIKVIETADGNMPALYQLDPREERDVRTGLGRSKRVLHAQLDIRIQRQQPDQYPDIINPIANTGPFSTILNNWVDNLYALFSPRDGGAQVLASPGNSFGIVSDCYPISCRADYGNDQSRVAVIYTIIEIIAGG